MLHSMFRLSNANMTKTSFKIFCQVYQIMPEALSKGSDWKCIFSMEQCQLKHKNSLGQSLKTPTFLEAFFLNKK